MNGQAPCGASPERRTTIPCSEYRFLPNLSINNLLTNWSNYWLRPDDPKGGKNERGHFLVDN